MEQQQHTKLLIIGSGPAGYTATIYAARTMLEPILIQRIERGGQLAVTTDVENYSGFAEAVQGPRLTKQMAKQAEHMGSRIVADYVSKADLSPRPFRLTRDTGNVYRTDTPIIATDAQACWLGLSSEDTHRGFGECACASATTF